MTISFQNRPRVRQAASLPDVQIQAMVQTLDEILNSKDLSEPDRRRIAGLIQQLEDAERTETSKNRVITITSVALYTSILFRCLSGGSALLKMLVSILTDADDPNT